MFGVDALSHIYRTWRIHGNGCSLGIEIPDFGLLLMVHDRILVEER